MDRYFLFQAALIPCVCLRNDPSAPEASSWRAQIATALRTITAMSPVNTSSDRCHKTILDLCGRYLNSETSSADVSHLESWVEGEPVDESPQTQINNVINMMWPNVPQMGPADVVMGDDAGWMEVLNGGGAGF